MAKRSIETHPGGYTDDGYVWNVGNGHHNHNSGTYNFRHNLPINNFYGAWYTDPEDVSMLCREIRALPS